MAKFCTDCGHRLHDPDGPCPVCESGGTPRVPESGPSPDDDRRRTTRVSQGRRIRRIVIAVLAVIIILAALAIGACTALSHFRVIDLPLANPPENLQELAYARMSMTEKDDKNAETRTFVVTMPDYEQLFSESYRSDDPDRYLRTALEHGQYDIVHVECTIDVDAVSDEDLTSTVYKNALERELTQAITTVVGKTSHE